MASSNTNKDIEVVDLLDNEMEVEESQQTNSEKGNSNDDDIIDLDLTDDEQQLTQENTTNEVTNQLSQIDLQKEINENSNKNIDETSNSSENEKNQTNESSGSEYSHKSSDESSDSSSNEKQSDESSNNENSNKNIDESSNGSTIEKQPSEAPELIIIDLESTSRRRKKPRTEKKTSDCINSDCKGGTDMKIANNFCLNFFKVNCNPKRRQVICKDCRDIYFNSVQEMANMLVNGESLFNFKTSVKNDCVEILDSDEEVEDIVIESKLTTEEKQSLDTELNYYISFVMDKYNFDKQIDLANEYIETGTTKLKASVSEIIKEQDDMQRRIDTLREKLYENRPRNKELDPVDLVDEHYNFTAMKKKLPIERTIPVVRGERRSSRKIAKPVNYNEEDDVDSPTTDSPVSNSEPSSLPQSPSKEVVTIGVSNNAPNNLPPATIIIREKPKVGENYYAMKSNFFGAWSKCKILEMFNKGTILNDKIRLEVDTYRVQFEPSGKVPQQVIKYLNAKQLAYLTPCPAKLIIGTRVIAVFWNGESHARNMYAGIIAEPASSVNNYRYLVFFDDAYAQYVRHENVRLIVEENINVWEDLPPKTKEFIQSYLKEYPERPMVKLTKGQIVRTERNGRWWPARVVEVDASLVSMLFENDNHKEWIYRGSRRLAPLYTTNQNQILRQSRGLVTPQRRLPMKKHGPYVEYTRPIESIDLSKDDETPSQAATLPELPSVPRAVAKKSTASALSSVANKQPSMAMVPFLPTGGGVQPMSKVIYYAPRTETQPQLYKPHTCGPLCAKKAKKKLNELKDYSILMKPILAGWFRACVRYSKSKREIRYVTPCSRVVRTMQELHLYLRITKSEMSVDMFDFNFWVHILAEFSLEKTIISIPDLSHGREQVPIPCMNYVDGQVPDPCTYTTEREPTKGVNLNLDEDFLCSCDCTDDCQDKMKCACWQLTLEGTMFGKTKSPDLTIGYVYKRLLEPVITGIYECNKRCKCASTCLNRVAQQPLSQKLQVFKTSNRGWGIRCLNDIPQGSFICIYAGQLLTEQMANEGGKHFGDEYLAELDYIEVVERLKEGYESDVQEDATETSGGSRESQEDEPMEDEDEENEESNKKKDKTMEDSDYICNIPSMSLSESSYRTRFRSRANSNSTETFEGESEKSDKSEIASSDVDENKQKPVEKEGEVVKVKEEPVQIQIMDEDCITITISDDEETTREPSSFIPTAAAEDNLDVKYRSVRSMFGEGEACYVMDAKITGNIGRYLNHSCSPNVFVQNVFVDTHDIRFPWVAFFALTYIRAGTELTWNYNYDVGSVPGKIMYCHCGSDECRGRLL